MATQMFLRYDSLASVHRATDTGGLRAASLRWRALLLATARGSANQISITPTVAGPTSGIENDDPATSVRVLEWISEPLAADVVISGSITLNIWAEESSMNANVGAQVIIERLDSQMAIASTILNYEKGTVLPKSIAAQNW